jgi:hypothetical protein
MIKNGYPGSYKICANYYSNHRQDLTGGTTIWFTIFTNYMKGKKKLAGKYQFCLENEKKQTSVLRLTAASPVPTYQSMNQLAEMQFEESAITKQWENEWTKEFEGLKKKWDEYNRLSALREEEWQKWNKEEKEILQSNQEMINSFK